MTIKPADYTPPMGTPTACTECPHCQGLIYVVLRKGAPIALPAMSRATALIPKTKAERNARSVATTVVVKRQKPPSRADGAPETAVPRRPST